MGEQEDNLCIAGLDHQLPLDDTTMQSQSPLPDYSQSTINDGDVKMDSPTDTGFPVCPHDDAIIGRGEYIWRVGDWREVSNNFKVYSDPFYVPIDNTNNTANTDGWWFKILMMPRGQDRSDTCIALYLAIDEQRNAEKLRNADGEEWHLCADFCFSMHSHDDDRARTVSKYVHHRFDAEASDWGFSQFLLKHAKPDDQDEQQLTVEDFVNENNNQLLIKVNVRLVNDPSGMLWIHPGSLAYDSKRATGCVGLLNQGATCYMNSILQSLFLTNAFRRSIYHIPTEGKDPHDSIPLALQRLFYAMTFSAHPPNTNDLTASFGWDLHESFTQHDVQEFLRVLMDDLEEKMKGTEADGFIDKLFGGRVKKVIRCLNVDFESSRTETIYDVQLPVAGCPTLKDSLDAYIAREMMVGDNQYRADGHGLQDAEMFNVFDRLPPVLHMILMRYRYDPFKDATVKINDRFEFPEQVDFTPYMSPESVSAAASSENDHTYLLHSVLVHSGDGHGGHYTAFIRPDPVGKPDFWLKFDDTRVTVVSRQEAMDDNFGGNPTPSLSSVDPDSSLLDDQGPMTRSRSLSTPKLTSREAKLAYYKRVTNAYMLVYIRKSEAPSILCPFTLADIPTHIIKQLEEEHRKEEERRQERLLEQTTVKLSVYTPDTIKDHPGYDLFCAESHPVCPITPCHRLRLRRDAKVSTVIDQLATIDPKFKQRGGRLYTLAPRRNRTLRFDVVLFDSTINSTDQSDVMSLDFLSTKMASGGAMYLFAEPIIDDFETGQLTNLKTTINIFFKSFDPISNQLRPMHGLLLDKTTSMLHNEPAVRRLLGVDDTVKLQYYEEVKVGRVDKLAHPERPLVDCELQSGDIIVVVPDYTAHRQDNATVHSLLDYYDHIQSMLQVKVRQSVNRDFTAVNKRIDDFDLVISAKATIADLVRLIHAKAQWPADQIRPIPDSEVSSFRSLNNQNKHLPEDLSANWLAFINGTANVSPSMAITVTYELLPVTLSDYKTKRMLKVRDRDGVECQFWVNKKGTVADIPVVGTDLCKHQDPHGSFHFFELSGSRIIKSVPVEKLISDLLADELLVERYCDISVDNQEREVMIPGYLHNRDIPWGSPFMFKLIVGEPIGDTKKRIATRLNITGDRDLAKLAVTFSRYGKAHRHDLTDADPLFPEMRPIGAHEQLAVEMAERAKPSLESAIKIKRTAPSTD